jgi:hypothetical protein
LASRVPTTEAIGNLLEIKGAEGVFSEGGSYTLEEIDLNDRKVCRQFPPARSSSEMHELHCAWMAGAASATIVVSMDHGK